MDTEQAVPSVIDIGLKRLCLRYPGTCVLCGAALAKGEEALYEAATKTVRCSECPSPATDSLAAAPTTPDEGVAGDSARRVHERRRAAREQRVKKRLGNFVGGVVLAVTEEPQSIRAWERGSIGEQKLAKALVGVPGISVLHDRVVPRTRGNIDHLVVGPAGIFVVDTKLYRGMVRIRDRGGLFGSDLRLYVGSRDCSQLADNMGWQVEAVQRVLDSLGMFSGLRAVPVLCFIDGEWPLISPPEAFRGVRLEGPGSLRRLVLARTLLDPAQVASLAASLAVAFPAK